LSTDNRVYFFIKIVLYIIYTFNRHIFYCEIAHVNFERYDIVKCTSFELVLINIEQPDN